MDLESIISNVKTYCNTLVASTHFFDKLINFESFNCLHILLSFGKKIQHF